MDKNDFKRLHSEFKTVLEKIKQYDRIVCYRHVIPDYDAFGSQMGFVTWIRDNFPGKDVRFPGESNRSFVPSLFPEPELVDDEWYDRGPFLAIVTDTANTKRISESNIEKADYVIKIDHHPDVDPYGNINIVYPNVVAASQLVALFALSRPSKYILSKEAAYYLYTGIVGDSGRFLYPDTDGGTLRIAADLIDTGFDLQGMYDRMYAKTIKDIEAKKFVLNKTQITEGGTAWYTLSKEELDKLDMLPGEGKIYVNEFRGVEGIVATVSCTEDADDGVWRVSLRSNRKKVNGVATKYRGGGHDGASGATLESLDELPQLLADLDAVPLDR